MTLGLRSRLTLAAAELLYRRPLLRQARRPAKTQWRALRRILDSNAETTFGRAHGFASIRSRDAYRAAVPYQMFEALAPLIDRQADAGEAALTAEAPVYFARTSGSTGPARDFPVTPAGQAAQRSAQRAFVATLYRDTQLFSGDIAAFSGAYVEGRKANGLPYGSASGQSFATAPSRLRRKLILPDAAAAISDADAKRHVYALAALASENLSGMITANPSTLLALARHLERHADLTLRDLRDGRLSWPGAEGPDLAPAPVSASRVRAIERSLANGVRFEALWPHLKTFVAWTGGNCQVALEQLRPYLPADATIVEIGYRASEFIGTVNIDAKANLCLPALGHVVFEFAEESDWEQGGREFLWLDELEVGARYYVFATTPSGLYRYHINDVVEVSGRIGATPTLAFVRKGQGATSITGEKLYEEQAMRAVANAAKGRFSPAYFVMVADAPAARYRLHYEVKPAPGDAAASEFADAVDRNLRQLNIEYDAKRASGRLGAVSVALLRPGAGAAIAKAAVAAGQREAQLKLPALVDGARWPHDMSRHAWPQAS